MQLCICQHATVHLATYNSASRHMRMCICPHANVHPATYKFASAHMYMCISPYANAHPVTCKCASGHVQLCIQPDANLHLAICKYASRHMYMCICPHANVHPIMRTCALARHVHPAISKCASSHMRMRGCPHANVHHGDCVLEKNRHTGCDWLRLVDLFQARGIAYSYTTHTHKPNRCAFLNWGEGGRGIKCILFPNGRWMGNQMHCICQWELGGNQMHSASRWEVGGKSNVLHFPRGGEDKCIAENGAQEAQNEPTNGSTSMGPSCASVGVCQNSANRCPKKA